MRVPCWYLPLIPVVALALAGCGGATPGGLSAGDQGEPHIQGEAFPQPLSASAEAQAQEIDYHGRRALQLTNGLVTAVADPASGRLVSFTMGSFEFLRSTEGVAQASKPASGGDLVEALTPGSAGVSLVLSGGAWKGEILTARGLYAEVKLSAAEDQQSHLKLTRTLRLYADSTRLTVTDALTNAADKPVQCSLQTLTQLTGVIGSAAPAGQVRLYAPLAPAPNHPEGFWSLGQDGDTTQFHSAPTGRLLEVTYNGLPGEVALHLRDGWLGYTESGGNRALVRRFTLTATGQYPDDAPARLRTAKAEAGAAYVETLTSSPVQDLQPGATLTLAQDWYATVVPGPIVDTADYAVISQSLLLKPEGQAYRLTGRLGVFAPGTLLLSPVNAAGQPLGDPIRLPVAPDKPITLDQLLLAGSGATAVRLALENSSGTPLATLAQVPLPSPTG